MKNRNPLFVAGFPYGTLMLGYIGMIILDISSTVKSEPTPMMMTALILLFGLMLIGAGYGIYWLIMTASSLRRETGEKIPLAILLVIPLANYWWMWRYGQAVEKYTKGKVQGVLAFIVIALLGSIGMGILQDKFNQLSDSTPNTQE